MAIENRPYVGTWQLNNRGVVRHTPDALVYLNGDLTIPGCPTCGGAIDLQKYITSVSVDPTVEGVAQGSITMQIPRPDTHSFFRDGQFRLHPGLEINIYFRGYFPVQGSFTDVPTSQTGGVDVSKAALYPYYHVFHGVVTEISHEYSGGETTASLTCSDMLHFWQYQHMTKNGAVFGTRPSNSKVKSTLVGSNFSEMTPYSLIYTLFRDVMGSAGGVGFALSSNSNNDANSTVSDQSMWSMAMLYWEKRFAQHPTNLRMYGMDGSLYGAYEQAFVGRLSSSLSSTLTKQLGDPSLKPENELAGNLQKAARAIGYDPASTYAGAASENEAKTGGAGINITQMQAFTADVSTMGSVNFFETEYQTKTEIVEAVKTLTGYEFYQDVDGDFVFKPPFYNLDTSSSRVYVIKDIDIISFSYSEGEPEATAVKATASSMKNMGGVPDGEWGKRSEYIDWRLVAQFGWRNQAFETAYLSDSRSMFFACVNRMDLFNIGMKRAQCQIPMRPELRPGLPIYVEYLDCFFYIQSFNHSFQFGGQCTTSLTLVGRRAKFHAPGKPPSSGKPPTIKDIFLSDPWLPPLPLEVKGNDGLPRLQGFPNVVLALDPEILNPLVWVVGADLANIATENEMQALIRTAMSFGVLELDDEADGKDGWLNGPFKLRTGDNTTKPIGTAEALFAATTTAASAAAGLEALSTGDPNKELTPAQNEQYSTLTQQKADVEGTLGDLRAVIAAVQKYRTSGVTDEANTANYFDALGDLKSSFSPGSKLTGYYRYYSSSHPDENQQGQLEIVADAETSGTTQAAGLIYLDPPLTVFGFKNLDEGVEMGNIEVKAGLPLMRPNTGTADTRSVPTATHQIGTISFSQHGFTKTVKVPRNTSGRTPDFSESTLTSIMQPNFEFTANSVGFGATVDAKFHPTFTTFVDAGNEVATNLGDGALTFKVGNTDYTNADALFTAICATIRADSPKGSKLDPSLPVETQFPNNPAGGNKSISKALPKNLAKTFSQYFQKKWKDYAALYGAPGNNKSVGSIPKTPEEKAKLYDDLFAQWTNLARLLSLDRVQGIPGVENGAGVTVVVPSETKNATYTAVFPVSDASGYEVIGSYRYGRGLSIEPGGNFETLQKTERFANPSVAAVDEFLSSLVHEGTVSLALGKLAERDPIAAAEIAASVIPATSGAEALAQATADPTMFENAFRNFQATSKQFSQKVSVTNAAYGLADLGTTATAGVCECKGAEADLLLLAYGEQVFVSVDQPDEPSKWVADQMLAAGVGWTTSQSALRGQVLDGGSNQLFDAFQAAGDVLGIGANQKGGGIFNAAGEQISGAVAAGEAQLRLDTDLKFDIDEEG